MLESEPYLQGELNTTYFGTICQLNETMQDAKK